MRVTRRSMLRGLGLGTATLFGRPLVKDAFAQAGALKPRRLLVLCMPNCSVKADWAPRGGRDALAKTGDGRDVQLQLLQRPARAGAAVRERHPRRRPQADGRRSPRRRLPPLQHRRPHPAG